MYANFTVYELKVLKGPDRLLRMRVIFSDGRDPEESLYAFFEVVNGILFRNHKLTCNLNIQAFLKYFKKDNTSRDSRTYGYFFSGQLELEILIRKFGNSEFLFSYYPSDLEFERDLTDLQHYLESNGIDLDDYQGKYTLNDMREGVERVNTEFRLKFYE